MPVGVGPAKAALVLEQALGAIQRQTCVHVGGDKGLGHRKPLSQRTLDGELVCDTNEMVLIGCGADLCLLVTESCALCQHLFWGGSAAASRRPHSQGTHKGMACQASWPVRLVCSGDFSERQRSRCARRVNRGAEPVRVHRTRKPLVRARGRQGGSGDEGDAQAFDRPANSQRGRGPVTRKREVLECETGSDIFCLAQGQGL